MIIDLSSATFAEHGQPVDVVIQAPLIESETIELAAGSRTFWKDVLREGQIDYKGHKLDFTGDYLNGLALAHREGAFDYVPIVFAPEDNKHTQAVEAIRGDVLGFARHGDRLRALVKASTDEAAEFLRNNPNVGCSVRIEQPIERADGKRWPAAIQHVLVTANPRVTGLGPWEPVDLAADDRTVIDLSTFDFADGEEPITDTEEIAMADTPSAFTDEETVQLRALLAALSEAEDEAPADEDVATLFEDENEGEETETPAAEVEPEKVLAEAGLSNEQSPQAIELAAQLDAQAVELGRLRAERDTERYEKLRDRLTRELGVPPAITDLARPLLEGSRTVELAAGDPVDVAATVEKLITELAKARLVDLSAETVFDADAATRTEAQDTARASEMAAYATQYGL